MATIIKPADQSKVGRPKRTDKDNAMVTSIEKGTKPGEARKSYILNTELTSKIDAIAFWEGRTIKDVAADALQAYVTAWEKKKGQVQTPGNASK